MRRIHRILTLLLAILALGFTLPRTLLAQALTDSTSAPSLVISQVKITSSNGQFLSLYNQSGAALDMSTYQLEYFNNYDLAEATSSKLISLSGVVPPHGFMLVADDTLQLCYQTTLLATSLGFSSTAGLLQVLHLSQTASGNQADPVVEDYVAWSKKAAVGVQVLPVDTTAWLARTAIGGSNPASVTPGSGQWETVQADPSDACRFVSFSGQATSMPSGNVLLPGSEPPIIIKPAPAAPGTTIPAADNGLKSPLITELLPNPPGTGTDAQQEFIELFNPNDVAFDLSGFSLEAGTKSVHSYSFPLGTMLQPGYTAFYTSQTGLGLTNNGGQAVLYGPLGNVLSQTDAYGSAADGQAWALGNGTWQWSTEATPGDENVITAPPAKTTKKKSSKAAAPKQISGGNAAVKAGASYNEAAPQIPVHPLVLALVGGVALLYGAYEYRKDLANLLFRLGANLGTRRGAWFARARR